MNLYYRLTPKAQPRHLEIMLTIKQGTNFYIRTYPNGSASAVVMKTNSPWGNAEWAAKQAFYMTTTF